MESIPLSEIEKIAGALADKLIERQNSCRLSPEEQQAVIDIIKTKKSAVKIFLWIWGALVLWILKDAYVYVISHLTIR